MKISSPSSQAPIAAAPVAAPATEPARFQQLLHRLERGMWSGADAGRHRAEPLPRPPLPPMDPQRSVAPPAVRASHGDASPPGDGEARRQSPRAPAGLRESEALHAPLLHDAGDGVDPVSRELAPHSSPARHTDLEPRSEPEAERPQPRTFSGDPLRTAPDSAPAPDRLSLLAQPGGLTVALRLRAGDIDLQALRRAIAREIGPHAAAAAAWQLNGHPFPLHRGEQHGD